MPTIPTPTTLEEFVNACMKLGRWNVGMAEEARTRIAKGESSQIVFADLLGRLQPGPVPPPFR